MKSKIFPLLLIGLLTVGCQPSQRSVQSPYTTQASTAFTYSAGWEKSFLRLQDNPMTGKGVKVALLDTEFQDPETWLSRIKAEENFLQTPATKKSSQKLHADLITKVLLSTAPDVELYHGIVATPEGLVQKEALINGLKWSVSQGVDIVNMSISFTNAETELEEVLQEAFTQGIVLVAASGNDGAHQVSYPAISPYVLAVGGSTGDGNRWKFSNFGPEVDFCMPAVHIQAEESGSKEKFHEGTSYSAVFLTSVLARLKEETPKADTRTLEKALKKMTKSNERNEYCGYGIPTF